MGWEDGGKDGSKEAGYVQCVGSWVVPEVVVREDSVDEEAGGRLDEEGDGRASGKRVPS